MSVKTPHWTSATAGELGQLARAQRLGLISDLDGTLSRIVDVPDEAQISARNQELLDDLAPHLALLAIVSGRGVEDLRKRVPFEGARLIGNHGMESWLNGQRVIAPAATVEQGKLSALVKALGQDFEEGVWLEDKGLSAALHYRGAQDPPAFRAREIQRLELLTEAHDLRFSEGRMVFEFKVGVDIDKGSALRDLVAETELDGFLFLGDDITDIAALHATKELREAGSVPGYGIGVQSAEGDPQVPDAADFYAEAVAGIEAFLSWLLSERKASST